MQNQISHAVKNNKCCLICGQKQTEYLEFNNEVICLLCEQEIVCLKANDPQYTYFLWKIRGLFEQYAR